MGWEHMLAESESFHVVCFLGHVVCLLENSIPHGWNYFHPQQDIVHGKYFYKSCFDTSNIDWCMRLRPD